MNGSRLYSIEQVAQDLAVSEAVIAKFIRRGWIITVKDGRNYMITAYGLRRLTRILDLYEKSYPLDSIEMMLND